MGSFKWSKISCSYFATQCTPCQTWYIQWSPLCLGLLWVFSSLWRTSWAPPWVHSQPISQEQQQRHQDFPPINGLYLSAAHLTLCNLQELEKISLGKPVSQSSALSAVRQNVHSPGPWVWWGVLANRELSSRWSGVLPTHRLGKTGTGERQYKMQNTVYKITASRTESYNENSCEDTYINTDFYSPLSQ